ncbi:hypothetical protein GCM10010124_22970 [Pilimelia terevasa]|uniref:DUF2993 domain-containing protein n=1 Tax=Pilimelia terevasa TaxID=53372 RepID=A0A8J3FJL8_9ACTN|nr:DUF2993 domain-containing protein [Pilimelia terevasa]GGK29666.1 hypothetical protein GCM10010124_22970 [Pilimelia terevasa]
MSDWNPPPRPGRKRRRGGKLLVVLLLLGGSLIGLDRFGVMVAEEQIGKTVHDQLVAREVAATDPDVDVRGFPFLWQAVTGDYRRVDILLSDVQAQGGGGADGQRVRLSQVRVRAENVRATLADVLNGGNIVARRLTGTATLDYASVQTLARQPGLQLSEADGRLRARLPVTLLGRQFTVVGVGRVEPAQNVVRLRFDELDAEGADVPEQIRRTLSRYGEQMAVDIPLPPLPFPLTIARVDPGPAGLTVTGTAADVPLR